MRKHEEKIYSGAAEPVHDAHAAANYGVCSGERFAGQHTQGKSGDFGAALRLDRRQQRPSAFRAERFGAAG